VRVRTRIRRERKIRRKERNGSWQRMEADGAGESKEEGKNRGRGEA
jgi:hypothetical protein